MRPAVDRRGGGEVGDDELFARVYPGLRRLAAVVSPDGAAPDDLVQEALARTLARHQLSDLRDADSYLRLVIVRLAANERRRLGRARGALARLESDQRSRGHRDGVDPTSLPEALMDLGPEDRAILYLTVVEGATVRAAARQLGRTEASVRMRRHRALRRLRTYLEERTDG
jgi:RNA polymerase sigma-70 factor (ECF subfamily)